MADLARVPFNDDSTIKGIEGWSEVRTDTLVVFVQPTSNIEDWLSNFISLPVPIELQDPFGPWCHAGYRGYAYWLTGLIWTKLEFHPEVTKVTIVGYSMGGGIAQIAGLMCQNWLQKYLVKVISIDGPRTTSKLPYNLKLYRNRGSLVADIPPWFKKAKEVVYLNNKWKPFWKSHYVAQSEIENIIKGET